MNLGPAAHAPARIIAPVVANPSCLSLISTACRPIWAAFFYLICINEMLIGKLNAY
jgi:hypothetical protein